MLSRDPRILTMTDGLIITTRRSVLPEDLATLQEQVPVVLVQFRFPHNAMPSIHADYRLAAQLIGEHLVQRFVRQVGILWALGQGFVIGDISKSGVESREELGEFGLPVIVRRRDEPFITTHSERWTALFNR
ncbi:MAG: hypothetical protein IMHGJWDQ_000644 [Candidatus Fervidibacter sp.]